MGTCSRCARARLRGVRSVSVTGPSPVCHPCQAACTACMHCMRPDEDAAPMYGGHGTLPSIEGFNLAAVIHAPSPDLHASTAQRPTPRRQLNGPLLAQQHLLPRAPPPHPPPARKSHHAHPHAGRACSQVTERFWLGLCRDGCCGQLRRRRHGHPRPTVRTDAWPMAMRLRKVLHIIRWLLALQHCGAQTTPGPRMAGSASHNVQRHRPRWPAAPSTHRCMHAAPLPGNRAACNALAANRCKPRLLCERAARTGRPRLHIGMCAQGLHAGCLQLRT